MMLRSSHFVSEVPAFSRTSWDLLLLSGALDFLVFPSPLLHPPPPVEVEMVSLQPRSDKPVEDENNRLTFINSQYWI